VVAGRRCSNSIIVSILIFLLGTNVATLFAVANYKIWSRTSERRIVLFDGWGDNITLLEMNNILLDGVGNNNVFFEKISKKTIYC
jgi:hypothetical protein